MNGLETKYSQLLEAEKHLGKVLWWKFHPLKLRLANPACWYEIDFMVILTDMTVEFVETKGAHAWDDAIVKFKVASEMFPHFRFKMVKQIDGEWVTRTMVSGTQV